MNFPHRAVGTGLGAVTIAALMALSLTPAQAAPTPTPTKPAPSPTGASTPSATKAPTAEPEATASATTTPSGATIRRSASERGRQQISLQPIPSAKRVDADRSDGTTSPRSASANKVLAELPATSTDEFTMVGATWAAGGSTDVQIDIRTRSNGAWGDWSVLDSEAATTSEGASRPGTAPTYVGSADAVEVRARGAADARVDGLEVTLLNPQRQSRDANLPSTRAATAGPAMPGVINRAGWGADESWRSINSGCTVPKINSTIKAAVVHHTAGSNNYTKAQSASIVRGIYSYHVKDLGWCDIGYNFLVDKYGQAFEGRWGGMDRPVHGAHAADWNTWTMGVSMMGDFTSVQPTAVQRDVTERIVAWRLAAYYRDPRSRATINGITSDVISGHRQVFSTSCPGNAFWGTFGAFRDRVAALMGDYRTPIFNRQQQLGGDRTTGEQFIGEAPIAAGRVSRFGNLDIYSSANTPTVFTKGEIRGKFVSFGDAWSRLGLPTSDEVCGLRDGGCYNNFVGGAILYSPGTGAHPNYGDIRLKYAETRYEAGFLRYPTSDEICGLRDGGCFQNFQGGGMMWSPATKAHWTVGIIRGRYVSSGSETGMMRYPTTDEVCGLRGGGCYQNFQGGAILYSPATGAHTNWGGVRARYASLGYENSYLGYPTEEPNCNATTCTQKFQGGTLTERR